jgi:Fur family transcriptional regulator, ferric uptake regulator
MAEPASVGMRRTRQRKAVAELLDDTEDFRSAQDIYVALRRRGEGVGLTTVYRTLQALAESGDVDVLRQSEGESLYRRCSERHHHHLVCRRCGKTVEIEGPAMERWTAKIAQDNDFHDIQHTLEISGVCRDCDGD